MFIIVRGEIIFNSLQTCRVEREITVIIKSMYDTASNFVVRVANNFDTTTRTNRYQHGSSHYNPAEIQGVTKLLITEKVQLAYKQT